MAGRSFTGAAPFRFGLAVAVVTAAADQALKTWLLHGFGLTEGSRVPVGPFIDLVLAWNTGISYGLFQHSGVLWQWALLAFKAVAVAFILVWLARTRSRFSALSLGLIAGGAAGNAIDRLVHGAVMDFVLFHVGATWQWYVFNLADAAIVAGVIGLVYDSLFLQDAAKVP